MESQRRSLLGHVLPMALFILFLVIGQWLSNLGNGFALRHAEFWVYPTQTIICGAVLLWFRPCYELARPQEPAFALVVGLAAFVVWIAPQQFLALTARTSGFDPALLGNGSIYWISVVLRFLRLVLVVPLLEEVFWRSFLLRFLIDEHFARVPFGKFAWPSFAVVAIAFALSHSRADWPAALVTGVLYNIVAYRTRSLTSCVIAHSFTNLLLGLWIMQTRQWGFW